MQSILALLYVLVIVICDFDGLDLLNLWHVNLCCTISLSNSEPYGWQIDYISCLAALLMRKWRFCVWYQGANTTEQWVYCHCSIAVYICYHILQFCSGLLTQWGMMEMVVWGSSSACLPILQSKWTHQGHQSSHVMWHSYGTHQAMMMMIVNWDNESHFNIRE